MQAGVTLLILLVIDGIAIVALHSEPAEDPRARADGYHNAAWTPEYFGEYASMRVRWQPYAYWVGAEYESKYINVDAAGFRRTLGGEDRPDCKHPARIFTFGGSTMWGEGARDDETIASWIQSMLDSEQMCAQVTNMGQDGYVSTQEVLLLAEQLRRGSIPDLVIFYDGYNDVFAAENNGVAGLTYNEETRRKEFNLLSYPRRLYLSAASRFVLDTGVGELAKRLLVKMRPNQFSEIQGRLVRTGAARVKAIRLEDDQKLQESVVRLYLLNKILADAMASKYGFRSLTYWQPCLLDKNQVTVYEKSQKETRFLPGEPEFDRAISRRIAQIGAQSGIHDLSGVFHDVTEPYFIDEAHVTGEGNRIVAKAMLADIEAALRSVKPPGATGLEGGAPK